MRVTCANCNTTIDRAPSQLKRGRGRAFCSRSCATKINNSLSPKRKKTTLCVDCQAPVSRVGGRCRSCLIAHNNHLSGQTTKKLTLAEYWAKASVSGKHPSWKNSHIRALNRAWNRDLTELPCAVCGYAHHVELCHIKPLSAFPPTATVGEVNARENVIQLCRNHHWELDNGLLSLSNGHGRRP